MNAVYNQIITELISQIVPESPLTVEPCGVQYIVNIVTPYVEAIAPVTEISQIDNWITVDKALPETMGAEIIDRINQSVEAFITAENDSHPDNLIDATSAESVQLAKNVFEQEFIYNIILVAITKLPEQDNIITVFDIHNAIIHDEALIQVAHIDENDATDYLPVTSVIGPNAYTNTLNSEETLGLMVFKQVHLDANYTLTIYDVDFNIDMAQTSHSITENKFIIVINGISYGFDDQNALEEFLQGFKTGAMWNQVDVATLISSMVDNEG